MDALLAAPTLLLVLFVLLGLAATRGVDSRDGFADDLIRQGAR